MPALTKPFETYEKPGIVVSYLAANNTAIFKGALVGVNTSGRVVPMTPATANLKFIGVANESITAGTDKRLTVTKSGTFVYAATSPAADKVGADAFASDDNTLTATSAGLTNAYVVGTIVGVEMSSTGTNGYRIRIDNHTK